MDVKELKALLEQYPDDQPVFIQTSSDLHGVAALEDGMNCVIIYTK